MLAHEKSRLSNGLIGVNVEAGAVPDHCVGVDTGVDDGVEPVPTGADAVGIPLNRI